MSELAPQSEAPPATTSEHLPGPAAESIPAPTAPPTGGVLPGSLLDDVLSQSNLSGSTISGRVSLGSLLRAFESAEQPADALKAWFGAEWRETLEEHEQQLGPVARRLNADVGRIDRIIEKQVNAILHQPAFQQLESSWRGVQHLVECSAADGGGAVKVRLLSARWRDLVKDQERATDFDNSALFTKIYSDEFDTPGGTPFSMLIADYEIHPYPSRDHEHDDVETLRKLSGVAAAAFCPLITAASPAMFGLNSFTSMERVRDLSSGFRLKEFIKWRSLRETPDSRFLGLTLPRVLMRKPHRAGSDTAEAGLTFDEDVSAPDGSGYLWGNAAYAFAEVAIRAFGACGWLADIRGVRRDIDGGGLVTRLVSDDFTTDREGVAVRPSTDATIAENEEAELSSLGFLPLCHCVGTSFSAFYSSDSVNKPKKYDRPEASQSARLSSMLQYTLCVSRFAHALKGLARQKIGSGLEPEECQSQLRDWLMKYVTPDENAKPEVRARRPLQSAEVLIEPDPGNAGAYQCVMRLQPHYQLDDLSAELEFKTSAGKPPGATG